MQHFNLKQLCINWRDASLIGVLGHHTHTKCKVHRDLVKVRYFQVGYERWPDLSGKALWLSALYDIMT